MWIHTYIEMVHTVSIYQVGAWIDLSNWYISYTNIYIYIYIHIYTYIYIYNWYAHTCACTHSIHHINLLDWCVNRSIKLIHVLYIKICTYTYIYIFIYIYMYIYIYIYIYIYVCVCVCVYVCMYIYIYICVCVCVCMHTWGGPRCNNAPADDRWSNTGMANPDFLSGSPEFIYTRTCSHI